MLNAWLTGDSELIAKLGEMPEKLRASLLRGCLRLALDLQRHVQQDKLSGQVLNRRTGTLRASINVRSEETATGVEASVGTNVVYAGIHEYGGTITIPARNVTIHRRMSSSGVLGGRFTKRSEGGMPSTHAAGATVIHMPERSFLRSALADYRERIKEGLTQAIREGLR